MKSCRDFSSSTNNTRKLLCGGVLKRVQSGKVQQYAAVLFAVVAILTLVFTAFR